MVNDFRIKMEHRNYTGNPNRRNRGNANRRNFPAANRRVQNRRQEDRVANLQKNFPKLISNTNDEDDANVNNTVVKYSELRSYIGDCDEVVLYADDENLEREYSAVTNFKTLRIIVKAK